MSRSSTPASVELSPEEIDLIMTILQPLRYAKNTLTITQKKEWAIESTSVYSINVIVSTLRRIRTELSNVPSKKYPSDQIKIIDECIMAKRTKAVTLSQKYALHELVKNADAEKLLIIESRLITEINKLIEKSIKHLDSLTPTFSDCPGMFPSEQNGAHYKNAIFKSFQWKSLNQAGFARPGDQPPQLTGCATYMRVESILLSGVTRLNGMTKHDLEKYNFVFRFADVEEEFENMLSLLAKPINGNKDISPIDITTTVARIRCCFRPPKDVLPHDVLIPGNPVLLPEEHMSDGISVQWDVFGLGNVHNVALTGFSDWRAATRLHNWNSMAGGARRLKFAIFPTISKALQSLRECSLLAAHTEFSPSRFLTSML